MKSSLPINLEDLRVEHPMYPTPKKGSIEGAFLIPYADTDLRILSGCGDGWDHVSVSVAHRCPTWNEMCFVKNLFFEKEELVLQFHPPESKYKNCHPYVLHLWRPWNQKIQLPPANMI